MDAADHPLIRRHVTEAVAAAEAAARSEQDEAVEAAQWAACDHLAEAVGLTYVRHPLGPLVTFNMLCLSVRELLGEVVEWPIYG